VTVYMSDGIWSLRRSLSGGTDLDTDLKEQKNFEGGERECKAHVRNYDGRKKSLAVKNGSGAALRFSGDNRRRLKKRYVRPGRRCTRTTERWGGEKKK